MFVPVLCLLLIVILVVLRRFGVIPVSASSAPAFSSTFAADSGVVSETFGGGAAAGAALPSIGGGRESGVGERVYERVTAFASGLLAKLPLRRSDAPPPDAGPAGFDPNEPLPSSSSPPAPTSATEATAAASATATTASSTEGAAAMPTFSNDPTYANIGSVQAGKGFENPLAGQGSDL